MQNQPQIRRPTLHGQYPWGLLATIAPAFWEAIRWSLATPNTKMSRSTGGCAFPSLEQSELHKKEPRRSGAPRLYDYRLGPPLGAGWFLLEPEPDDELGDVLWFALG